MNRQSGFVATAYVAAALVLLFIALGVSLKVQTSRLHSAQDHIAAMEAAGRAQEAATKAKQAQDIKLKQESDNEAKHRYADLAVRYKRLQLDRSSFVPAASPGAGSPDRACFDRARLERAINQFATGVQGIAEAGDKALIDLDVARSWAKQR